jgi:gas vesicle protein
MIVPEVEKRESGESRMSENQSQPTIIVEKHGSGFAAFFWGALFGAAAALLLAPKTGQETQQDLRDGARRLRDEAEEKLTDLRGSIENGYDRARGDVGERVESARDTVRDRRRRAEEALKAGKDAARRARSDLEDRVAESKAAYRAALETRETDEDVDEVEPGDADEAEAS